MKGDCATISRLMEENVRLEQRSVMLDRLLFEVERKFPGETRFETALRYIRLEGEILLTRQALSDISDRLLDALPVRIDLARDYAPHKNIMAMHGVEPYAKKQRKPKAAPPPPIAS